ncbi:hypothetical protein ABZ820_34600 [Streptomyces diacarni]|uniref:hypothetical protein n=1 Tax=Streptomyces diacarni TaxID=2800381 RepID=UPI0033E9C963
MTMSKYERYPLPPRRARWLGIAQWLFAAMILVEGAVVVLQLTSDQPAVSQLAICSFGVVLFALLLWDTRVHLRRHETALQDQ